MCLTCPCLEIDQSVHTSRNQETYEYLALNIVKILKLIGTCMSILVEMQSSSGDLFFQYSKCKTKTLRVGYRIKRAIVVCVAKLLKLIDGTVEQRTDWNIFHRLSFHWIFIIFANKLLLLQIKLRQVLLLKEMTKGKT